MASATPVAAVGQEAVTRSKNEAGFTLLEVILAIAILAVIALMTVNVLSIQIATRTQVTRINNENHAFDMALKRITDDIQNAYITKEANVNSLNVLNRDILPIFRCCERGDFILAIDNFQSLHADSNQSNLAMIRYFTKTTNLQGRAVKQLVRIIDTEMAHSITADDVGIAEVVVPDLEDFTVLFWNGSEFIEEWDSTANDTSDFLPKMAQVHLRAYVNRSASTNATENVTDDEKARTLIDLKVMVFLENSLGQNDLRPGPEDYEWNHKPWNTSYQNQKNPGDSPWFLF